MFQESKKKKVMKSVDGQNWGRDGEKSLVVNFDWLLYKEQTPTYFVILKSSSQIAMYLIYYAHSYQRGWLSFE